MKRSRKKARAATIHIYGAEPMNAPTGWAIVEQRLMREFEFPNFSSAKNFVDLISEVAEEVNHHPDLHLGWGYVVVELFTHDEEKITEKDTEMARRINALMED
ncbi:MAG TPA: 4a-hydroxytetrahydrobiopterin dehydratase [Candidatus Poseidoniales archaeon]|nr:MAG TPA: 4a-hydroxytetrahydrobiopterin dehydratase [Candidatus Poseidoniales archaeon]